MTIHSWFKSVATTDQVNSNRSKRRGSNRDLSLAQSYEILEERRLLAVDLPGLSSPVDQGDFYLVNGEQVSLLRNASEITVQFEENYVIQQPINFLNDSMYQSVTKIDDLTFGITVTGEAGQAIADIASMPHVVWAAPVFESPESNLRMWPTDEIVVALDSGQQAEDVFSSDVYSSYRPVGGTTDQFVATIATNVDGLASLELSNALEADGKVAWASPNFFAEIGKSFIPADPLYDSQWHLENAGFGNPASKPGADVNASSAWDITFGDTDIVVAIMDDGVQTNHPDLPIFVNPGEIAGDSIDNDGNGWVDDVNGWNFTANSNNPNPSASSDNHGTAVAGVAAAKGDNELGVTGAAGDVQIMPIRFTSGTFTRFAEAIYYVGGRTLDGTDTWKSADVLNMSFSFVTSTVVNEAFEWSEANGREGLGLPMLAATGNSANNNNSDSYGGFPITETTPSAGNWAWLISYEKSVSGSSGDDIVRLAQFRNSDGTIDRFDSLTAPAGWNLNPLPALGSGWEIEDNPARAYGTSRYQAVNSDIGDSEKAYILSPTFSTTGAQQVSATAWLARSTQNNDHTHLRLFNVDTNEILDGVNYGGGNTTRTDGIAYPASLPSVIAVGASTDWDYRSNYSQFGAGLDFVAPSSGGYLGIYTTDRTGSSGYSSGDYAPSFGGTSSATPLAAGVAALMLSANSDLTAGEVRQILQDTSVEVGAVTYDVDGWNEFYGHGRIDAFEAVSAAVGGTEVKGSYIYYENSNFDGGVGADASDDAAIDITKSALLPGGVATFENYTGYGRGINGLMIDVSGLATEPTLATIGDFFEFQVGNNNDPSTWTTAPAPIEVAVRVGEGADASDRISLIWADSVIEKQWLEVTMLANGNTGLSDPLVNYWGNAVGETGNDPADAIVNLADLGGARNNQTGFGTADIDNPFDFNSDGRVNLIDVAIARSNQSGFTPLQLIDLSGDSGRGESGGKGKGLLLGIGGDQNGFLGRLSFDNSNDKNDSLDSLIGDIQFDELVLVGNDSNDLADTLDEPGSPVDFKSDNRLDLELDRLAESFGEFESIL